ncbi:FAD-dependent oxidoreductase [Paractinoplanes abujensis]|uniref:2-polyprenyl-6-methoxyphenol hydroxylase-like FAD-dependent oxidoreductase n=1 Tax=Paractinoplanes abujensis TaxID=882441 RepID=A0A7W7CRI4_9ACTN|nr:FAD-dependent monooxygenase [Actinoplanes abujensis]MBB4693405.1 2-polyprenyl-6-methoxyphenol hydroxylase-like FAD-dependent oxidoreductase [Actinoplanes abujensis]GID24609.1 FAD-dependent oxidoreductase [Actinoplanes abujensis]
MKTQRALIVGMGIGGLATALRLHDIGWETVLVERAAERRAPGYFIALFGTGRAAAERLGVLDAIGNRLDDDARNYDIDRSGRRRPGMGHADLPGAPRLVLRGDVESALFDAVSPWAEIRYATTPVRIDEHADGVLVTLRTTTPVGPADVSERFDLVVGADGLRSTVRSLHFGPPEDFLLPFRHMIGATILQRPVTGFRASDGFVLAEPGRSAWVFAFADHQPGVLFNYRTTDEQAEFGRPPVESIRRAFGPEPLGPVLEDLVHQFGAAGDALFDAAYQVRMPSWHTGRVVLLGDAAWSLTLYSGMGASSALAGADLLGTTLQRNPGNPVRALREWEQKLRPFIGAVQTTAHRDLVMFVPQTRRDRTARTVTLNLLRNPVVKRVMKGVISRQFREKSMDVAGV